MSKNKQLINSISLLSDNKTDESEIKYFVSYTGFIIVDGIKQNIHANITITLDKIISCGEDISNLQKQIVNVLRETYKNFDNVEVTDSCVCINNFIKL